MFLRRESVERERETETETETGTETETETEREARVNLLEEQDHRLERAHCSAVVDSDLMCSSCWSGVDNGNASAVRPMGVFEMAAKLSAKSGEAAERRVQEDAQRRGLRDGHQRRGLRGASRPPNQCRARNPPFPPIPRLASDDGQDRGGH